MFGLFPIESTLVGKDGKSDLHHTSMPAHHCLSIFKTRYSLIVHFLDDYDCFCGSAQAVPMS